MKKYFIKRQQVNCPLIVKTKGREVKILIDESNYVIMSDSMIISDKIYNIEKEKCISIEFHYEESIWG